MLKKKKFKQFYFHGVLYSAHDEHEVFEKYKEDHVVEHGEIVHIGKKYFRVIGNKLSEIKKEKQK